MFKIWNAFFFCLFVESYSKLKTNNEIKLKIDVFFHSNVNMKLILFELQCSSSSWQLIKIVIEKPFNSSKLHRKKIENRSQNSLSNIFIPVILLKLLKLRNIRLRSLSILWNVKRRKKTSFIHRERSIKSVLHKWTIVCLRLYQCVYVSLSLCMCVWITCMKTRFTSCTLVFIPFRVLFYIINKKWLFFPSSLQPYGNAEYFHIEFEYRKHFPGPWMHVFRHYSELFFSLQFFTYCDQNTKEMTWTAK